MSLGILNRYGRGGISKEKAKFKGPQQHEDVGAEAITIAEALKENGYATAHIGKYHVGGHDGLETLPENSGFDVNIGGFSQGHQPVCFASRDGNSGNLKISVVVILTDGLSRTAWHILKNVIFLNRCWVLRSM